MAAESTASPSLLSLDLMSSSPDCFLKMEDVHSTASASPPPSNSFTPATTQSSPPPVVVQSKQAKKRKSWGQELPEPKTNLPPRKRAKTDDEKEQRRIERIKRNRAAAHNSRERKRQETETLAVALARANAELEAYRKLHGPLPPSVVLPEVHLCTEGFDETSDLTATTPAPSLVESHGSQAEALSPASPAESIFHASNQPTIKNEPLDTSYSLNTLPPALDSLDAKSSLLTLDPTQHSAAMLCDLQCRSSPLSSNTTSPSPASWWTNLFLYLMASQFQTCYRIILVALWTLSPSRMVRLMQASTLRSTSRLTTSSTTLQLLRSTSRRLALSRTATGLSAPQERCAHHAPQRQSLDDVQRSKEELTARQAQTHQTQMALTERIMGTGNQSTRSDECDEKGVRRKKLT